MADRRPASMNIVPDTCLVCSKVAYPMESIKADGKIFHKACFRCAKCNSVLSLGNYAAVEGTTYCKPHFKELFKLKGNYSEGFRDSSAASTPTGESDASSTTPPQSSSPALPPPAASPAASPAPASPSSSSSDLLDRKALRAQRTMSAVNMPIKNATCHNCQQTVYAMDKVTADSLDFHKACFRCAECNSVLSLGKYAALGGKFYCKPHFKQLFALKGNYDEGFGRVPHKMNWVEGADSPSTETAAAP